jgi:hypothetical protein
VKHSHWNRTSKVTLRNLRARLRQSERSQQAVRTDHSNFSPALRHKVDIATSGLADMTRILNVEAVARRTNGSRVDVLNPLLRTCYDPHLSCHTYSAQRTSRHFLTQVQAHGALTFGIANSHRILLDEHTETMWAGCELNFNMSLCK